MSIPEKSGKFSLEELKNLKQLEWSDESGASGSEPQMLHFTEGGYKFDFLWHPSAKHKRIFVLFSGDAMRDKYDPPVFQRWSWAPHFPGHCLFVSDPSIYLDPRLGLAWYAGTKDFDPMPTVAEKVNIIREKLKVPAREVYSYGSSGGGFAALRFLLFYAEGGAIAINPQTVITNYHLKSVERYLEKCFGNRDRGEGLKTYPKRFSLLESSDVLKDRRIILIQNTQDTHHYEEHYKPFCTALGAGNEHAPNDKPLHRILFSHEGGHRKAESQEVFDTAMGLVTGGRL